MRIKDGVGENGGHSVHGRDQVCVFHGEGERSLALPCRPLSSAMVVVRE